MFKPLFALSFTLGLWHAVATHTTAQQQCQPQVAVCRGMVPPYQHDGSYFRAELFDGEMAKLRTTFYRGMTYRVVPCGKSSTQQPLSISILDNRGVGVFHSSSRPDQPYFDIEFGATGVYTIEMRYPSGEGCAAVLIGYQP